MHRLVREEQRPRLAAPALDEAQRHAIEQVGDVALLLHVLAVLVEPRVVDAAVAVEAHPVVVAGPRPAVVAHVPLADVRGLVAELAQLEVVVRQAVAHRVARHVVDHAVAAGVLPGHDRGAVRRADRRGVEGALEQRALARQAVDVRRLHVRMAAGAELVVAQVVHQDHQQVGLFSHGPRTISLFDSVSMETKAPCGTCAVMSPSKPASSVSSAKAAPCTRMGFTLLNTSARGTMPRAAISRSIQALATPPLAVSSTRILST